MKFKEKKVEILKALYARRFDGNYHDIQDIMNNGERSSYSEVYQLAKSLHDDGLIKMIANQQSIHAEIISGGIEFIEEDGLVLEYCPDDKFSDDDKKEAIQRIDQLGMQLMRLEVGQQIIYDDLIEELEELKQLVTVLGKKHWLQILKGKLIDAGFGGFADQVGDLIIETFKDHKLLGG